MEWIHEEGFCDEATRDKDWLDYANQLYDGREPIAEYERLKRIVGEFCATKTKAELLEAACTRRLLIAPVATPDDVVASAQFAARDYFDDVDDDALGSGQPVTAPGSVGAVVDAAPDPPRSGAPPRRAHRRRVRAAALGRARVAARTRAGRGRRRRSTASRCST